MIGVQRCGSGPAVGYLHGPFGNPGVHPFLEALGGHVSVVAPSLPNFQGSEPRTVRSLHEWLVATSETLEAAGLIGVPLIAASTGAMLACELLAIRPDVTSRLVLLSPLGLWNDDDPVHDIWSERTPRQAAWWLRHPARAARFLEDPPGLGADDLMEREVSRYRCRTAAASLMWPLPDHGLAERIARVRVPVSVIWGAEDRLMGSSYRDRWAVSLPDHAGTTVIDDAGHLVEWDQPERTAAAAVDALSLVHG